GHLGIQPAALGLPRFSSGLSLAVKDSARQRTQPVSQTGTLSLRSVLVRNPNPRYDRTVLMNAPDSPSPLRLGLLIQRRRAGFAAGPFVRPATSACNANRRPFR